MAHARDIMHQGAECIGERDTLLDAARRMQVLNVGSLPVCGEDDRLHGIITDRDIVVKCLANGGDPSRVTAGELAQGTPVWVDAGADQQEVIRLLSQHKIRRLPVMEDRRLVGMISEADIAVNLNETDLASFAKAVYAAPPTT